MLLYDISSQERDLNMGPKFCFYLNLKHGDLDHSATTAGSKNNLFRQDVFLFRCLIGGQLFCQQLQCGCSMKRTKPKNISNLLNLLPLALRYNIFYCSKAVVVCCWKLNNTSYPLSIFYLTSKRINLSISTAGHFSSLHSEREECGPTESVPYRLLFDHPL